MFEVNVSAGGLPEVGRKCAKFESTEDHQQPNKQTFPVGSVTLAPMMSSFCLDLTLLSCKLFYSLIRDFDSKGSMRAMLDGCGPKLCTADFVDVNLWSHLL